MVEVLSVGAAVLYIPTLWVPSQRDLRSTLRALSSKRVLSQLEATTEGPYLRLTASLQPNSPETKKQNVGLERKVLIAASIRKLAVANIFLRLV